MRTSIVVVTLVTVVVLWNVLTAQQEMLPRPGPGSGIVRVEGSVNVANSPGVRAAQEGNWQVKQDGEWQVKIVPAPFLRPNARYLITWADGSTERIVALTDVANGAWVMVEGTPRRWLNLALARAVEDVK